MRRFQILKRNNRPARKQIENQKQHGCPAGSGFRKDLRLIFPENQSADQNGQCRKRSHSKAFPRTIFLFRFISRNRKITAEFLRRTPFHIARNKMLEMRAAASPRHKCVIRHADQPADNRSGENRRTRNVAVIVGMPLQNYKEQTAHRQIHERRHQRVHEALPHRTPEHFHFFLKPGHFFPPYTLSGIFPLFIGYIFFRDSEHFGARLVPS